MLLRFLGGAFVLLHYLKVCFLFIRRSVTKLEKYWSNIKMWFCFSFWNLITSGSFLIFNFLQEGFAFAHCTTCKAPYHLRVHALADRKWRTMKFRFFVTRDILFIFFSVQIVGHVFPFSWLFSLMITYPSYCSYSTLSSFFVQVISLLAYLVYLIDGYQKNWLRLAWGFDSEASFYYICGKLP